MTGRARLTLADRGVVGAGAAMLVVAFTPWYTVRQFGVEYRLSGRHLGGLATIGVLLAILAAVRAVVAVLRPQGADVPLNPAVETLVAAVLALLAIAYRTVDAPAVRAGGSVHRKAGLFLALALAVVQVTCAVRVVRATGGLRGAASRA